MNKDKKLYNVFEKKNYNIFTDNIRPLLLNDKGDFNVLKFLNNK